MYNSIYIYIYTFGQTENASASRVTTAGFVCWPRYTLHASPTGILAAGGPCCGGGKGN